MQITADTLAASRAGREVHYARAGLLLMGYVPAEVRAFELSYS